MLQKKTVVDVEMMQFDVICAYTSLSEIQPCSHFKTCDAFIP